jgi:hypothetical protein
MKTPMKTTIENPARGAHRTPLLRPIPQRGTEKCATAFYKTESGRFDA